MWHLAGPANVFWLPECSGNMEDPKSLICDPFYLQGNVKID